MSIQFLEDHVRFEITLLNILNLILNNLWLYPFSLHVQQTYWINIYNSKWRNKENSILINWTFTSRFYWNNLSRQYFLCLVWSFRGQVDKSLQVLFSYLLTFLSVSQNWFVFTLLTYFKLINKAVSCTLLLKFDCSATRLIVHPYLFSANTKA